MKVLLKDIRSASKRVRSSWDVDKLAELVQSIKEQGLLVPVKLRPNGEGYDVVFGHRRIGAAREAGLTEVEAIVEGVDDDTAYIQALTENVVREDMAAYDIALALKAIKGDTGWTNEKIGEMFGWVCETVAHYLSMLKIDELVARQVTHHHIIEAKAGTTTDADAAKVLKKAAEGELSTRKTRQLAEVVTSARQFGGQAAVTRLLEKQADDILRAAKPVREYVKPRPPITVTKVEGEVLFQWIKDARVLLAEEGLKAVSSCVSDIARSRQDRGGGQAALKLLRGRTQLVLDQIDETLNAYK